jgi:HEAT repeat protein
MLDFNPGAAALVLVDLKVAEAAPKLAALLKNPKTQNRNEIAQAIGKLPAEQAVEALASAAQENEHKDCILQDVLVKELEKFQDARVIQALQRINLDESAPNGCVMARTDASQSLSQRGARPFPPKQ